MSPPATNHSPSSPGASSPEDTALALDLISSEASHELVHALNYLRFLVRSNKGSGVSAELIDYAGPEIERLEQLLTHMYSFKLPALTLKKVSLQELLEQSLSALRDSCAQSQVELTISPRRSAGRFSSTKSPSCLCLCKPSSCGFWRTGPIASSAAPQTVVSMVA